MTGVATTICHVRQRSRPRSRTRAYEIAATQVGAPEIDQPQVQSEGSIGRFRDPHRSLGVRDGLVEPAKLGEHVGEVGPRERRLDGGRPEALGAQVALERDVTLEEGGRIAEFAPGGVRHAQKGRGDHLDRAIAEGSRNAEALLPEPDRVVVVACAEVGDSVTVGSPGHGS